MSTEYPPQQPPAPRPATGALPWFLGLLVLVCVPFVSSVVASLVMYYVGRAQAGNGPLAAENGRRAANWGLTYFVLTIVLVVTQFALVFLVTGGEGSENLFPLGIPITIWGIVTVVHIVLSLWGGIAALNRVIFWGRGVPVIPAAR